MLHIYCGNGKGKTTAAIGLCVRAAGAGMKVAFVQLMKGNETSELASLKAVPNIEISRCNRDYGFFKNMTAADKAEITACHNKLLNGVFFGEFDVIILDEFCAAYNHALLDRTLAEKLILSASAEVVLTGRDPAEPFLNAADYVSEIHCEKHPYEKGIAARRGIEF